MDDLIISIPSSERAYIDAQVASGKYQTPSDAVRDLIRKAQLHAERETLDAMIREGINSGPAVKYTREWLEDRKRAVLGTGDQSRET